MLSLFILVAADVGPVTRFSADRAEVADPVLSEWARQLAFAFVELSASQLLASFPILMARDN